MDKFYAIKSLSPNIVFSMEGDKVVTWESESKQPTQSEIDTEIIRLQAEYDAQLYSRNRKLEYDALNQFELISDDAINSSTTHADAITAIKTKWPKNNKGPIE